MRPWRAGCGGTRTSGSEGGGGETGSRKADTALRRRPLHRRGQRYLTSVVDHQTGAIVWCSPGRNAATLQAFFDELGERKTTIAAVSIDMSGAYEKAIRQSVPDAEVCFDPFVRHEALPVRAGCKTLPPGCRGSPVKLRAV